MYRPKQFEQNDPESMLDFIRTNPFASLVSNSANGLNAEHIPFLVRTNSGSKTVLCAHIAKANPLWKELRDGDSVLVLFQGSNSYISPNWYPSKQTDSRVVPTWNYTAVHAKGDIEFIHDAKWLLSLLNDLTGAQEQAQEQPWKVSDAPEKFIERQLSAIVGIEIVVDDLIGKFKLSQNQSAENRQGVKSGLRKVGHEMSDLIDV